MKGLFFLNSEAFEMMNLETIGEFILERNIRDVTVVRNTLVQMS